MNNEDVLVSRREIWKMCAWHFINSFRYVDMSHGFLATAADTIIIPLTPSTYFCHSHSWRWFLIYVHWNKLSILDMFEKGEERLFST
jgi:hypothetical protein